MPSFRKTRDILAFALDARYIDEEEFLFLWSANISKNPDLFCERMLIVEAR